MPNSDNWSALTLGGKGLKDKSWPGSPPKGNQRICSIGQPEDRTGAAPLGATPVIPQPQQDKTNDPKTRPDDQAST